MPAPAFAPLLQQLRATGFRDIAGARMWLSLPISERLVNEIIASTIPADVPVRDVSVIPEEGNRLAVRVTPRTGFLPSITIKADIERQPELPDSPILVLRMATVPALFRLAGSTLPIAKALPPGVSIEGDRILVDLRALIAHHGVGDLFPHLRRARVTTAPGRFVLDVELRVE